MATNHSNGLEFQLKEWGLAEAKTVGPTSTNHGWSIFTAAKSDYKDTLLGGEQFLSLNLKAGTSKAVADKIVALLSEHCLEIGYTTE